MTNRKAWNALTELELVLEKNNLLNNELRSYIWNLEDYLKVCEQEEETRDIIYDIKDEIENFLTIIDNMANML